MVLTTVANFLTTKGAWDGESGTGRKGPFRLSPNMTSASTSEPNTGAHVTRSLLLS